MSELGLILLQIASVVVLLVIAEVIFDVIVGRRKHDQTNKSNARTNIFE
jgi:hypothetical protein